MMQSKNYSKLCLLAVMAWLMMPALVFADAKSDRIAELQRQIDALEQQAAQYQDSIASERAKGATLKNEIAALQAEIRGLETQISSTVKKIDKTKVEIDQTEATIFDTETKINHQKDTVARLLLFVNRNDKENLLTTLIKNENVSDFFHQAQYAANVQTQLLAIIDDLKSTKTDLEGNKNELQGQQSELEQLKQEQAAKQQALSGVKSNKDNLLKTTKGQEAAYQKMLDDIEQQESKFFTEQRILENEVITSGNFIVHVTANPVPKKGKLFRLPEDHPHLTQGYGMTPYAKRGGYGGAPHNGIDYATGYGTPVKAIGDGTVIAAGTNTGWGNWIAIQHPNNLVSIYGHFSSFGGFGVGMAVKQSDVIGYEGATGNVTGSHVHLSIYKDFFTYQKNGQLYFNYFEGSLNPLDYL